MLRCLILKQPRIVRIPFSGNLDANELKRIVPAPLERTVDRLVRRKQHRRDPLECRVQVPGYAMEELDLRIGGRLRLRGVEIHGYSAPLEGHTICLPTFVAADPSELHRTEERMHRICDNWAVPKTLQPVLHVTPNAAVQRRRDHVSSADVPRSAATACYTLGTTRNRAILHWPTAD